MSIDVLNLINNGTQWFRFSIITTALNETFTLPLLNGAHNFLVDWGDHSDRNTIIAYNVPEITHTYSTPGTYIISMKGLCTAFSFNNIGDKLKIKEVLDIYDMGFTVLNFSGCANLIRVSEHISRISHLTNCTAMYQGCTSLEAIPQYAFGRGASWGHCSYAFNNCISISSIPLSLFRSNVHAIGLDNVFRGCVGLQSIPVGLFDNNPSIGSFAGIFFGCSNLTSIPIDLFKFNIAVGSFSNSFAGCTKITSIPSGLFDTNTKVQAFDSIFHSCTSIGAIPTDLFKYTTEVTNFGAVFYNCSNASLTSLPIGLLDSMTKITGMNFTFGLTKILSIPADFFKYNTLVTNFGACFYGCTNLTTLPTDLFRYNVLATHFNQLFHGNTQLATVPTNLFKFNVLASNFVNLFYGCNKLQHNLEIFYSVGESNTRFLNKTVNFTNCFRRDSFIGIQGTTPDLWNCNFGTGTPTKTNCWFGVGNSLTSLSNYADIPIEWL